MISSWGSTDIWNLDCFGWIGAAWDEGGKSFGFRHRSHNHTRRFAMQTHRSPGIDMEKLGRYIARGEPSSQARRCSGMMDTSINLRTVRFVGGTAMGVGKSTGAGNKRQAFEQRSISPFGGARLLTCPATVMPAHRRDMRPRPVNSSSTHAPPGTAQPIRRPPPPVRLYRPGPYTLLTATARESVRSICPIRS